MRELPAVSHLACREASSPVGIWWGMRCASVSLFSFLSPILPSETTLMESWCWVVVGHVCSHPGAGRLGLGLGLSGVVGFVQVRTGSARVWSC